MEKRERLNGLAAEAEPYAVYEKPLAETYMVAVERGFEVSGETDDWEEESWE